MYNVSSSSAAISIELDVPVNVTLLPAVKATVSTFLKDKETLQYIIWWVLEIPLVIILGKWYFKQRKPSLKKDSIPSTNSPCTLTSKPYA